MNENKSQVGLDGLIEFGQYLVTLNDHDCEFEVEIKGRMVKHTLSEIITLYEAFLVSNDLTWKVGITHKNYASGTMVYTTKEFRRKRPSTSPSP